MNNTGSAVNGSVTRACFILDLFTHHNNKMILKDIAKACNAPVTTILPVVRALENAGYLEKIEETKQYHLGVKFIEKGNIVSNGLDLREQSAKLLRELSLKFNMNSHLAVLDGCDVVYIDRIEVVVHTLSPSYIGKRIPAFCTALGKAILSHINLSDVYKVIKPEKMYKVTPNTVTDLDKFIEGLEEIRTMGYALDDEEYQLGGLCVSAPIFGSGGEVLGAISVSMTKTGENLKRKDELIASVVETAAKISYNMGYREK